MKKRLMKVVAMIVVMTLVITITAVANIAVPASADGIMLIGDSYGNMKSVTVTDCAGLVSALQLHCEQAAPVDSFGIQMNCAQFGLISGKVYVLSFYTKATSEYDTLTVSVNDLQGTALTQFTYHLSGQWTEICFPFTASGKESNIKMTTGGKAQIIYIGGISVNISNTTFEDAKSGYFMVRAEDWESVEIPYSDKLGLGSAFDVIANGEYIYAIAGGKIHVLKEGERGNSPTLVKSTQKYGNLRQMSLTDDGKGLIVTARAGAVFAFDISNPENPVLVSRLDSLEHATGIDIQGKYCFIADRVCGISIFDIEDLRNPVMISHIPASEAQDCKIYNGYLYVGEWGACKISVYDVRNPDSPVRVKNIYLKGRGDGVNIQNGILYAATGHMEPGHGTKTSPGYATGNGMEIYNVEDPLNPVLLSRVRTDGRMYCGSPDIWRVEVAGNYAYLSSTYNGIYVYDTSNKRLPKRVAHINVVAKKGEAGYSDLTNPSYVFPFDTKQQRNGALIDCDVQNGTMYIVNNSSDLYVLHGKDYIADRTDKDSSTIFPNQHYNCTYFTNDLEAMGLKNAKLFQPGSQVWSCARYGNYTYVAAGTDGIYVIDDNMNIIKNYPAKDITQDIQIYGNKLYTAENSAGLYIYEIDVNNPENIIEKGSYNDGPIVEVALSPDARYALVQRMHTSRLLDVSDIENPKLYKNFSYSMVYQNQLTRNCAQNRYLMVFANGSKTVVIDFGENGSYAEPVINESWTSGILQQNGISADGNLMFATGSNGVVYSFDPSDEEVYTSALSNNPKVKKFTVNGLTNATWVGVPTVIGDYAFVAMRGQGDFSILKLPTDRASAPVLLKKVTFKGNPGRPIAVGRRVYLPLGYGGLVSFEISDLTPNLSTLSSLMYRVDGGKIKTVDGFKASDIGGEYEISVLSNAKRVDILAVATVPDSTVTISGNGVIDIENGEREATVTVVNGEDISEFKITVKFVEFLPVEVVNEQFTSPYPYELGNEITLPLSGSRTVGKFNDNSAYTSRNIKLTALAPGMNGYQAGGTGNIIKLVKGDDSEKNNAIAEYALPEISATSYEQVTIETRVYIGTRVATGLLQERIGVENVYINFRNDMDAVRIAGTNVTNTLKCGTFGEGAWRRLKFIFYKSSPDQTAYDRVKLYYDGYINNYLNGEELEITTPIASIDKLRFDLFINPSTSQKPMYIDYIKVIVDGTYKDILDTPVAPVWEGNNLRWTALQSANVAAYDVTLYNYGIKDRTFTFGPTVTGTSGYAEFANYIAAHTDAVWTATVTARGTKLLMSELYEDSEESEQSVHRGKLYGIYAVTDPEITGTIAEGNVSVSSRVVKVREGMFMPYTLVVAAYDGKELTDISFCSLDENQVDHVGDCQTLSASVTVKGLNPSVKVIIWKDLKTIQPLDGAIPVDNL